LHARRIGRFKSRSDEATSHVNSSAFAHTVMSAPAMKWALSLPYQAQIDQAARHVLLVMAWEYENAPRFVSVGHLAACTSMNVKTARRALASLVDAGLIEPTGKTYRLMPFYRLMIGAQPATESSTETVEVDDPQPLPELVGVNGSPPLPDQGGVETDDLSHLDSRPLPFEPATPTRSGTQVRRTKKNKEDCGLPGSAREDALFSERESESKPDHFSDTFFDCDPADTTSSVPDEVAPREGPLNRSSEAANAALTTSLALLNSKMLR
jgi:hypothetical protein